MKHTVLLPLFIAFATGTPGHAQTMGFSGAFLPPFKYVAPAGVDKGAAAVQAPKRAPALQRIVDLNAAGDYQAAGTEGLVVMGSEPVDEELQLIVANSLAWTGRIKEAVPAYQGIRQGKFSNEATIGLANINRWRGRDDLALPMYQSVLGKDPANADALEGLALAHRELAPRTTIKAGGSSDSSDLQRRSSAVNHQWRDASGSNIFEVELGRFRDWLPAPTPEFVQREATLRYQSLNLALKPSLELNLPTQPSSRLLGKARIKLFDDQVSVGAGRINWGKQTLNPNASSASLAANYLGADITQSFSMGEVVARFDYYDISDGNTVTTGSVNFNSAWRPLGNFLKPFAGVETRYASLSKPDYWSPTQGYGSAYAGLLAEWGEADWNLFASAQLGLPLYGDAGNSWSVSAGGKRWLSTDLALGINLWSMASWRNGATYRAQSVDVNLEKIWQ